MSVLTEFHQRHKQFHAKIAVRAANVVPIKRPTSYVVPNTQYGVPKIAPAREPEVFDEDEIAWNCEMLGIIPVAASKPLSGPLAITRIQKAVCRYYSVTMNDLLSSRRTLEVVKPRQVAMYLCKELTTRSLPEIGRHFKGKDHTTVLHAVRKIRSEAQTDEVLATDIDEIITSLDQHDADATELERDVAQSCRDAWLNARELESYRRHPGARKFLLQRTCMDDIEKARDYLSRVLDDMRGIK